MDVNELKTGTLAKKLKIPYYHVVTATMANKDSCIYKVELKGKLEEGLKEMNFDRLSISRPAIIMGGDKIQLHNKILYSVLFFVPRIQARDLVNAMRIDAEDWLQNGGEKLKVYSNSQLKEYVKGKY